jgi:hypothetical protein
MDLNYVVTCQYLLKFHTNYIIILLSTPQNVAEVYEIAMTVLTQTCR